MTDLIERLRHDADTMCPGQYYDRILNEAADRITALERELAHFTGSGIIEVAIRNASVSEYMRHWEGRTERAEAERDALRARVAALEGLLKEFAQFRMDPLTKAQAYRFLKMDAERTALETGTKFTGKSRNVPCTHCGKPFMEHSNFDLACKAETGASLRSGGGSLGGDHGNG